MTGGRPGLAVARLRQSSRRRPRAGRPGDEGRRGRAAVLLATLLACGALCASCRSGVRQPRASPAPWNVILVSIDTLRPDHLGCYGYPRPTSPSIDALCGDSVVFQQAVAQAPSTLHSHASMLTSLLPHHHQASWGGKTRLPAKALSLAEVLQASGYLTAAFTGGGQMDRIFGLDQGFDQYVQPGEEHFLGTVRRGIEWLDQRPQPERPFFLFLHSYETHHPYDPRSEHLALFPEDYDGSLPEEISIDLLREINRRERQIDDSDLAHIERAYDAEIRSMDDGVGVLVGALRERSLYDDTLIVLTSDHGEEFGEHGVVGWHSHTLYDELLLVPLIIKFPRARFAGVEVAAQVRSLDIPPTVVAALGLEVPEVFTGVDLAGLAELAATTSLVAISRMDRPPGRDISSVRTESWKLHRSSLYDLADDPREQWGMALSQQPVAQELEALLEGALSARERLEPEQVVPTDATLEELRALGYLQ